MRTRAHIVQGIKNVGQICAKQDIHVYKIKLEHIASAKVKICKRINWNRKHLHLTNFGQETVVLMYSLKLFESRRHVMVDQIGPTEL